METADAHAAMAADGSRLRKPFTIACDGKVAVVAEGKNGMRLLSTVEMREAIHEWDFSMPESRSASCNPTGENVVPDSIGLTERSTVYVEVVVYITLIHLKASFSSH